jgi:hypothetical protein
MAFAKRHVFLRSLGKACRANLQTGAERQNSIHGATECWVIAAAIINQQPAQICGKIMGTES